MAIEPMEPVVLTITLFATALQLAIHTNIYILKNKYISTYKMFYCKFVFNYGDFLDKLSHHEIELGGKLSSYCFSRVKLQKFQ